MWFKGGNQKSINIKDARDEILPCSQPELWPLCTRCSWQTFLLKIIINSSGVSFQETKEHSAAPFVTKARIGVPLMINSCFLTVSSFFSTNLVPALWIVLFDWVISTYFMFCSNFVLYDVMLLSHLSNSKSKYHRQHSHRLKLYLRAWCTWNITWLSNRIYLIENSDLLAGTSCVYPSQGSFLAHFFPSDSDRAGNLQAIFILREYVWFYGHDTLVTELRI